ncbi:MAG: pyruvate dehydrogenase complex dihydrolipoamide acetyltransferase [Rhodospirillaceae bacterium]|nr:pyruvate dehydrogenase complex dihydrolipoamide acetyltransferase [Rhodospirillaceae bacterium]
MSTQILMPALSPTMTEGKLAKWLKKEGDKIKSGDVIAEIETDKATMEMEAVDEGVLGKILIPEGTEKVSVNEPIAVLLEEGEKMGAAPPPKAAVPAPAPKAEAKPAAAPAPAPQAAPAPKAAAPAAAPAPAKAKGERIFISPLARRLAKDAGLDPADLTGSGPRGRIVRVDVERAIAGGVKRKPATAAGASGTVDIFGQPYKAQPNSGVRKTIAKRLTEAKSTIPHFYLSLDCQIDELLSLRKKLNERAEGEMKLSVNDFVIKAVALALRKVPQVNSSWTDDAVLLYENVDISVAVATPDGLITPIIRNADQKSVAQISTEMRDLASRAKAKKLKLDEFQGGGFSISNLGMFGIREFQAIINPPQSGIMAVGKGEERVVVKNGQMVVANVVTCTLSCDHRSVDGAVGAEFMQAFQRIMEDPLRMLL